VSEPVLFLIPARGGSQRIPGKNLQPVAGIPLVARSIRTARRAAARMAPAPHRVVCSTDDPAIAEVAEAWGAEVLARPAALATATATSADVAVHALDALAAARRPWTPSAVVLLQPTSPLVDPDDVLEAIEAFERDGLRRGVAAVSRTHPASFHVATQADGSLTRVESDARLVLSGAVYVVAPERLRATRSFVGSGTTVIELPAERSVDVDEPADLALAEALAAAAPIRPTAIAGRAIGTGLTLVIAEAGVNHDGVVERAHALIDAAASAGADVVKFQTFDPDALAAAGAPTAEYQRGAVAAGVDQRSMLAALALPPDAWPGLRAHAQDRGLLFLSSPFDDASADLLDRLDVAAFKVGSGELTNVPFLRRLAARGRPLLVSTGMAEMVEVAAAVDAIEAAGDPPLALFHCVSSYPARAEDANLRAIETMRQAFGVPVGWSDHTPGIELPLAAVAAGATLVEKHLTLDRTSPGPDHAASLEPDDFRRMVDGIRTVEAALGDGIKRPVEAERPIAAVARKSLHWSRSLAAGEAVGAADLAALRPGTGLSPALEAELLGRRTARSVEAGAAVREDDVEPAE
jgi:N,N'-diacetyllegionaminate synthase